MLFLVILELVRKNRKKSKKTSIWGFPTAMSRRKLGRQAMGRDHPEWVETKDMVGCILLC
jgi:hypothetical protein